MNPLNVLSAIVIFAMAGCAHSQVPPQKWTQNYAPTLTDWKAALLYKGDSLANALEHENTRAIAIENNKINRNNDQSIHQKLLSPELHLPTLLSPNIQDFLNLPYMAVPDFYITPSEKKADNWGPALNRAILAVSTQEGGGTVRLLPHTYHIAASNLHIPEHVTLEGAAHANGMASPSTSYTSQPYALLVDPGYTITMERNSSLSKLGVFSSNLPASLTTAQDILASVAQWPHNGTAITIEGADYHNAANDVSIDDVFIMGFNQALYANWCDRLRINQLYGDDINGISLNNSHDASTLEDVHFFPFIVNNHPYEESMPIDSIGAGTDGTVELTLSSPSYLQTGYWIALSHTNCDGQYKITRLDDRHFLLQGTTYSPDKASSSGTLFVSTTLRDGSAFSFGGSELYSCINCGEFGWTRALWIGQGSYWGIFDNFAADIFSGGSLPNSFDHELIKNNPWTAIVIDSDARHTQMNGGYISGYGKGFYINTTDPGAQHISNMQIAAVGQYQIHVDKGTVSLVQNTFNNKGMVILGINDAGTSTMIANQLNGTTRANVSSQGAHFNFFDMDTDQGGGFVQSLPVVNAVSDLPECDSTVHPDGARIVVSNMRKPTDLQGTGSGGIATCIPVSGGYGWVYDVSQQPLSSTHIPGWQPAETPTISGLPECNNTTHPLGLAVYVDDLRKPGENPHSGTGGNAICTGVVGGYGWVSQFSGTSAVE